MRRMPKIATTLAIFSAVVFGPGQFTPVNSQRTARTILTAQAQQAGRPLPVSDKPVAHVCQFRPVKAGGWSGYCVPFEDDPVLTVFRQKEITSGVWRKDTQPMEVWAGQIVYSDDADHVEIEIYKGGTGVLRTDRGWFPISDFEASANAMQFQVDTSKEVPPSDLDRKIVERSATILSSESVWNRADNRRCAPTDAKWSMYCAMQKATIEVAGAFHHRRPALQVVRHIVDERTVGRKYHHRLMDYNNDPSTRLQDVQSLFAEALARIPVDSK